MSFASFLQARLLTNLPVQDLRTREGVSNYLGDVAHGNPPIMRMPHGTSGATEGKPRWLSIDGGEGGGLRVTRANEPAPTAHGPRPDQPLPPPPPGTTVLSVQRDRAREGLPSPEAVTLRDARARGREYMDRFLDNRERIDELVRIPNLEPKLVSEKRQLGLQNEELARYARDQLPNMQARVRELAASPPARGAGRAEHADQLAAAHVDVQRFEAISRIYSRGAQTEFVTAARTEATRLRVGNDPVRLQQADALEREARRHETWAQQAPYP